MTLQADIRVELGTLTVAASLRVEPGTTLAVIGPNGAGKTTLLRAVAGLRPLAAGRIALDGTVLDDPARGLRVPPERRGVGMVFQHYVLFPHLTVLENVAYGPRARGASAADARAAATVWLERLGVAERAQARPATLSGGEAQRVALARALAGEPRVLLLDEPLAALDVTTRAQVRRELRVHLDAFAGPRVLVTHDALDARTLADHVLVLEHGAVVQQGRLEDVTRAPRTPFVAELLGVVS